MTWERGRREGRAIIFLASFPSSFALLRNISTRNEEKLFVFIVVLVESVREFDIICHFRRRTQKKWVEEICDCFLPQKIFKFKKTVTKFNVFSSHSPLCVDENEAKEFATIETSCAPKNVILVWFLLFSSRSLKACIFLHNLILNRYCVLFEDLLSFASQRLCKMFCLFFSRNLFLFQVLLTSALVVGLILGLRDEFFRFSFFKNSAAYLNLN